MDNQLDDGPPRKKRKKSIKPLKGEDFWSQVEKWFIARRLSWGDKWSTEAWST
jgi:hypothetical protein